MSLEFLGALPVWAVFLTTIAVSLAAAEIGYLLGRRAHARAGAGAKSGPSMVGTTLGLLAFMLAFTFGMAASRYEARRAVVLDEANAIGTAYLRADLLPAPLDAESKQRLLEYIELRIVDRPTPEQLRSGIARSEELQRELFERAVSAATANPHAISGLFVQAMNELIDLHEKRLMAGLRTRIPGTIWAALWLLSIFAMLAVGLESGPAGSRGIWLLSLLVLSFAIVMSLIADLDHPQEGFLTTSQQALIDTRESMRANP